MKPALKPRTYTAYAVVQGNRIITFDERLPVYWLQGRAKSKAAHYPRLTVRRVRITVEER